jgi:thiol-disulfide isomerase/thioredoxin
MKRPRQRPSSVSFLQSQFSKKAMKTRIPLVLACCFLGSLGVFAQDDTQTTQFDVGEIEVPDGKTVDIVEFLKEMSELQSNLSAEYGKMQAKYQAAVTKVTSAQAKAASKILSSPGVSDDDFTIAARYGLSAKVRAIASQSLDEQRQVVEMVKRQLLIGVKKGLQRTELNNASSLVSYLERGNEFELAIDACKSFAEILKDADDSNSKAYVTRFDGTARRLGLMGNPIDLTGKLLDGSEFDWSQYQGKVVLVDFWATWCGPCLAEAPNVLKNYNKYHDRGFEVVGISLDTSKAALENYVKSKNVPWANLFQPGAGWKHPMAVKYGVSAIPTVFLVDRQGNVVSLRARGAELGKQLKRLLETKEDLEREVVECTEQIEGSPKDPSLFSRRAKAHIALKNWEQAASDWKAAVELQPGLAQQASAAFKTTERWQMAAEFGMAFVEQKPEDVMRWLRLSPVLVESKDRQLYGDFCKKMLAQFKDSENWRDFSRIYKACLLVGDAIPMEQVPVEKLDAGLESANDAYAVAWGWGTRALVAYRNGDAKLALECLEKSTKHRPVPYAKALNDSLSALAHHQLGNKVKAEQSLESASRYVNRYRSDESTRYHHDVMIADILLQEAKQVMAD